MWALYALTAAVLWGLEYTITEKVLAEIRLPTLLTLELFFGFVFMLAMALSSGDYKPDILSIFASKRTIILVLLVVLIFNVANSFILLSIESKNATLSGLIEVSYPLFIAAFSWFIFKENDLSIWTVVGAVLILAGVGLVFAFNK